MHQFITLYAARPHRIGSPSDTTVAGRGIDVPPGQADECAIDPEFGSLDAALRAPQRQCPAAVQ